MKMVGSIWSRFIRESLTFWVKSDVPDNVKSPLSKKHLKLTSEAVGMHEVTKRKQSKDQRAEYSPLVGLIPARVAKKKRIQWRKVKA